MQAKPRALKTALLLAPLLLLGAGCSWGGSGTSTSPQQTWSDMTDEQRLQVRAVVWAFGDLEKKTPEEVRAIEPLVINVMDLGNGVILPFPEEQFELVTPAECPDDCPEDHYVGSKGLTLDLRRIDESRASCEWGIAASTKEMEVEQEALNEWLEEYLKP